MPFAVDNMIKLYNGHCELYMISFCGKRRSVMTHESVDKCLPFVKEQFYISNRKKKGFVCKLIGCHFMIDDRIDVLEHVKVQSPQTIPILFGSVNERFMCAQNWSDVYDIVQRTDYFNIEPDLSVMPEINKTMHVNKKIIKTQCFHFCG